MNCVLSLKLFALLHSQHLIFTLIKFFFLSSLCFIYKSLYLIVDTVSFVLFIPDFQDLEYSIYKETLNI